DLAPHQVTQKKLARLQRKPFFPRNADLGPTPRLGVAHRIDTTKLEQQRAGHIPHRLYIKRLPGPEQIHPAQVLKSLRMIAERDSGELTANAPWTDKHRDGHPFGSRFLVWLLNRYSNISRVKRRL